MELTLPEGLNTADITFSESTVDHKSFYGMFCGRIECAWPI